MKKTIFLTWVYSSICFPLLCVAQKIDTVGSYSVAAYMDVYAATYTDSAGNGNFQKFPTASPRSNTIGLNVFQVASKYDGENVRAAVTIQIGDIPLSTWSKTYNYLQEAHAGLRVSKKLWVDLGFFRTHFGTEYLLPVENITSSVAVATYYEPYYEAGLRFNYDPTPKLEINLFLLNGYSVLDYVNTRKSVGVGITYKLSEYTGIGYTNYVGDDAPDSVSTAQIRLAQNAFFNYQKKKIKIQVGTDLYIQQHAYLWDHSRSAIAYSALGTIGYQVTPKWEIYGRGETLQDGSGYISTIIRDANDKLSGYKLWGCTAGIEYKHSDRSYVRLEARRLQMAQGQDIFYYDGESRNYRYEIMMNAGISLSLLKRYETRTNL